MSDPTATLLEERSAYRRFFVSISAALLFCFIAIFVGLALRGDDLIRQALIARARSLFQEIVLTRQWNAKMGGVYVLKGPGVESNPYLANPDLKAADGRLLTLRNPSLMTKEISALAEGRADFSFRMRSLRPINPANAPDDFERAALESFERGTTEAWTTIGEEGRSPFRYMGVLKVEADCLRCHAAQGYEIGEVRGGISVSFPVESLRRSRLVDYSLIAVLGVVVSAGMLRLLYAFFARLKRQLEETRRELELAAVTDALTGLHNRRYALGRFEEAFAQARRTGGKLSCAIADADDFKKVNDELGHQAGDAVLKALAVIMKRRLRPYDLLGRYGGEEFVFVFPGAELAEAMAACERVRSEIESGAGAEGAAIAGADTPSGRALAARRVTVSFGVAALEDGDATAHLLLNRADAALYRAKARGKNRCADAT